MIPFTHSFSFKKVREKKEKEETYKSFDVLGQFTTISYMCEVLKYFLETFVKGLLLYFLQNLTRYLILKSAGDILLLCHDKLNIIGI